MFFNWECVNYLKREFLFLFFDTVITVLKGVVFFLIYFLFKNALKWVSNANGEIVYFLAFNMPIAHKINVEGGCMSSHLIAKIITHQQCVWLVAEKEWQIC
jgi:hypothetical protein